MEKTIKTIIEKTQNLTYRGFKIQQYHIYLDSYDEGIKTIQDAFLLVDLNYTFSSWDAVVEFIDENY